MFCCSVVVYVAALFQADDSLCIDSQMMKDIESVEAVYGTHNIHCRYLTTFAVSGFNLI